MHDSFIYSVAIKMLSQQSVNSQLTLLPMCSSVKAAGLRLIYNKNVFKEIPFLESKDYLKGGSKRELSR